ncbi:MAG TPA: PDZ domain-containing protein, partial [Dissulfurispiraceae bacterium]
GKEVRDPAGLRNMAANTPPGKEVTLKVLREGKPKAIKVTIAEMPAQIGGQGGPYSTSMGVHVQGITPAMRKSLDIPNRISGVIVTDIEEGSKAANILARNDIIMEVNRKEIKNMKDYEAAVSHIGPDQPVLLLVYRSGAVMYVTIAAR